MNTTTRSAKLTSGRAHLQNALRELEQAVSDLAGCENEIPTEVWGELRNQHLYQLKRFAQDHFPEATPSSASTTPAIKAVAHTLS